MPFGNTAWTMRVPSRGESMGLGRDSRRGEGPGDGRGDERTGLARIFLKMLPKIASMFAKFWRA